MQLRLTMKAVEKAAPPSKGRSELHDTMMRGLTLRVTNRGKKTWSLLYRVAGEGAAGTRGKLRRLTLGPYPLLELDAARDRARDALLKADKGIDPAVERLKDLQSRQTRTFDVVCEKFISLYARPNVDTWRQVARILRTNVVPVWRNRLIETIDRATIHELLDELADQRTPGIARETRKHLSKLFNWAVDRGMLVASPVAGMRRPELAYRPRERVLTMDELRLVWDAAGTTSYPFGSFVRLLILTGQRRSEVANMQRTWLHNDLGALEIPAAYYKTSRPQVVPLSPQAQSIIAGLPNWNAGEFLLSNTGGARPISGFSKYKATLNEACGFSDWTLHDLRRSMATHMARLGVPQEHIERVLGHTIEGIAGTYNRYSYLAEKRVALEQWGSQWN